MTARRIAGAVGERTVVLHQTFERFPGEIETVVSRIAALERGHDAERLGVVIEAAKVREALIQRAFAGVAERRVTKVMAQRRRLGEILVEPEHAGNRARNL